MSDSFSLLRGLVYETEGNRVRILPKSTEGGAGPALGHPSGSGDETNITGKDGSGRDEAGLASPYVQRSVSRWHHWSSDQASPYVMCWKGRAQNALIEISIGTPVIGLVCFGIYSFGSLLNKRCRDATHLTL